MRSTTLQIENASAGYGNSIVIEDISLKLSSGELLCILGANGSGKTTLLKLIMGILRPIDGQVLLNSKNIQSYSGANRAKLLAYIPQSSKGVFDYSVLDVVLMGKAASQSAFSSPKQSMIIQAMESLEKLGIDHLANEPYMNTSSGEQQLALIARAIFQDAGIIVMDEPTANLDFINQKKILNVIESIKQSGKSIVMTTHNPQHPFELECKALLLKEGQILAKAKASECLNASNLSQAFENSMEVVCASDSSGNEHKFCVAL